MMNISTSLEYGMKMAKVSAYESAVMMKEAGFDGVDVSLCHNQCEPEKQLRPEWMNVVVEQGEALKKAGLEASQCHLPYYGGHLPLPGSGVYADYEALMMPGFRRAIEACGVIGCKVAVMHPYFDLNSRRATIDGNLRIIEKLMPDLEKYDVIVALENIYAYKGSYITCNASTAEDLITVIEEAGTPRLGACIDTGHANIFHLDIAKMARLYGKHLIALHVNGNAGGDEHVIPYTMSTWAEKMDYHAFSAALKDIGYKGSYNLEVSCGDLPASVARPFYNYAAAVARVLADEAE